MSRCRCILRLGRLGLRRRCAYHSDIREKSVLGSEMGVYTVVAQATMLVATERNFMMRLRINRNRSGWNND